MRFAYADPPYLGQGKRYAHLHPDALAWDDPATHVALVDRLEAEYPDGWAASLMATAASLACYLRPALRVAVWVRPGEMSRGRARTQRLQTTWEALVYRTAVPNALKAGPRVRDSIVLPPVHWTKQGDHNGTKPPAYCRWVLDLLGYDPATDELVDLFPGEGSMTEAARQQRLWDEQNGTMKGWSMRAQRRVERDRRMLKISQPLGLDPGAHIDGSMHPAACGPRCRSQHTDDHSRCELIDGDVTP